MKSDQKISTLETAVSNLSNRLNTAESCGINNSRSISEIKVDLDWIKKGISEIKLLIEEKKIG